MADIDPNYVPAKQKLTPIQLVNMNRRDRRMIGKLNGIKIPGVQDIVRKDKDK